METHLTLDDIASQFGLELDSETKRLIANALNLIAKRKGDSVQMVRKRLKDKSGNYQSYKVSAYPLAYADTFERLCLLIGVWN